MFTDAKIFEIRKVESHAGIKVLYTPFPVTHEFIPQELNVYQLLKKINGDYMVGEFPVENFEDFGGTIISAKKFILGETIQIGNLIAPNGSIDNYMVDNVSKMRIFVIQPMPDEDLSNFDKEMNAIRLLVSKYFNRNIDDIEMLDQLHVDDPYDIDENFSSERERSIYRLTRSMRMLSTATHAIVFTKFVSVPECDIEIRTCRNYKIPLVHVQKFFNAFHGTTDPDVVDALSTIAVKYKIPPLNDTEEFYVKDSQFPWTHPLDDSPIFMSEEF